MNHIVVGVDGSSESWRAVDVAIEAAQRDDVPITAVHAKFLPAAAAFGIGSSLDVVVEADAELEESLAAGLRERNAHGGPQVGLELVEGRPLDVLLHAVERLGADLLVVGHAGHGGALSWLGSVANGIVHRAEISVLIAR